LVYALPLASDLQYVVHSDFGFQHAAVPTAGAGGGADDAQWFGINQYLFWTCSSAWKWGANLEWFRDDDGFRVLGAGPSFGAPNARSFGRGPFAGDFYRVTPGPQWTPHGNVLVRPSLLFDVYDGPGQAGARPFDDGASRRQLLLNLDLVLFF
jgi:hypothetical protein